MPKASLSFDGRERGRRSLNVRQAGPGEDKLIEIKSLKMPPEFRSFYDRAGERAESLLGLLERLKNKRKNKRPAGREEKMRERNQTPQPSFLLLKQKSQKGHLRTPSGQGRGTIEQLLPGKAEPCFPSIPLPDRCHKFGTITLVEWTVQKHVSKSFPRTLLPWINVFRGMGFLRSYHIVRLARPICLLHG